MLLSYVSLLLGLKHLPMDPNIAPGRVRLTIGNCGLCSVYNKGPRKWWIGERGSPHFLPVDVFHFPYMPILTATEWLKILCDLVLLSFLTLKYALDVFPDLIMAV